MRSAMFLQKTASKGAKNRLMELEELLACISFYRRIWTSAENAQKAEEAALLAENTVNAERIIDSQLHSELGKRRKAEVMSEGEFIQIVN